MRGYRRSLLRQASVLVVLCCAFAVGASEALAQDPAPEPAPPNSSGPKPEAPPGAKRQAETPVRTTPPPPAPPRATPPPPAATNPPPAAVTPPPAPVYRPAPVQARRVTRPQTRERARSNTKPKVGTEKPKNDRVKVAAPAASTLLREKATSPDTLLMVGGLALFFLVLADIVFLTLSTRVLRTR
jgi:outer membrane biosynthesis protein TonB